MVSQVKYFKDLFFWISQKTDNYGIAIKYIFTNLVNTEKGRNRNYHRSAIASSLRGVTASVFGAFSSSLFLPVPCLYVMHVYICEVFLFKKN